MEFNVPREASEATERLRAAGYEAYLVGGCVRDLLLGRTPKDWDIATNADPAAIQRVFPDSFYENDFGTVGVKTGSETPGLEILEVTPYRTESGYSDKRRPDAVEFGHSLEDDLARRDFTFNALALDESKGQIVDPFKGQEDLQSGVLRTVGDPAARFSEDALRLMRAIRLVAELGFALDSDTATAIQQEAHNLEHVSRERIRDELSKILASPQPMLAIGLAQQLGLLAYIIPDLTKGVGVEQNQAHSYDVFGHLLRAAQHAADKDWDFDIRLAALLHDIAKPHTRQWSDQKRDWTFHGHEVVGAKLAKKAMQDLRFPRETIEKVTKLVRWHMFFSDPDQITLSAVRRMIRNVGEENIWDLLNLRICDRIGTGRPKEQPFRFRRYKAMVEEALRDPISVGMLKVSGTDLIKEFHVQPGPRIGDVLHALLDEVLDDPSKNDREALLSRASTLILLPDEELKALGEKGKERRSAEEEKEVQEILSRHHVD